MIPGFEKTLEEMKKIMIAKNHDYAGELDAFKNFRYCEELGICSTEQGLMVRMSDKMSRISNLLSSDAMVKDEKITDTLQDLANYSIILKCWLETKNDSSKRN